MPSASQEKKKNQRSGASPSPSRPESSNNKNAGAGKGGQEEEGGVKGTTSSLPGTLRDSLPSTYNEEIRSSVQRSRAVLKWTRKNSEDGKSGDYVRSNNNEEDHSPLDGGFISTSSMEKDYKDRLLLDGNPAEEEEETERQRVMGGGNHHKEDEEEQAGGVRGSEGSLKKNYAGAAAARDVSGERWALRVNGTEDMQAEWIKKVVIGGGIPERRSTSRGSNTSGGGRVGGIFTSPSRVGAKKTSPVPVKKQTPSKERVEHAVVVSGGGGGETTATSLSHSPKRSIAVRMDENGQLPRETLSVSPPPPPQNIFFCPLKNKGSK